MEPEKALELAIAKQEVRLQALRDSLAILRPKPVENAVSIPRKRGGGGVPPQGMLLQTLCAHGADPADLKTAFDEARGTVMKSASFDAMLSKFKKAGVLHKRDGKWFPGGEEAAG